LGAARGLGLLARIAYPFLMPMLYVDAIEWGEWLGKFFGKLAAGMIRPLLQIAWEIEHSGAIQGDMGGAMGRVWDDYGKGPLSVDPDWLGWDDGTVPELDEPTEAELQDLEDNAKDALAGIPQFEDILADLQRGKRGGILGESGSGESGQRPFDPRTWKPKDEIWINPKPQSHWRSALEEQIAKHRVSIERSLQAARSLVRDQTGQPWNVRMGPKGNFRFALPD